MEAYDLNVALREIVAAAVDERIGEVTARADAMVRLHGEYVKITDAARIMNVSKSTVYKLHDDGLLDVIPVVGVSVRSIAALSETDKREAQRRRAKPKQNERFTRIKP